jgi:hypothetical protein
VTENDKIEAGKTAIDEFLKQFGNPPDELQLLVLEIILQEIMNENMALFGTAR